MTNPTTIQSVKYLKEVYTLEELKDIVEHGCSTGLAHAHIYYNQTWEFFQQFEDEVEDELYSVFGEEYVTYFANDGVTSIRQLVNNMVWGYIELVAQDIINQD
jgi:hypothetical protein